MTFSFNLIDQPWIPCVKHDGTLEEVSLRDLLVNAHNLLAISCETSLMTASVMPVALAVLHCVFGPANRNAWKMLWQGGFFPPEQLDAYFTKWYERFDLFHPERPFYQVPDERVQPKSIIHLIHSIGNTGTLFTHANDDDGLSLSAAEAARHLITAQTFRTAGLSGLEEKFTDSPLTRGVLFWGNDETVFKTLLLNLLPYPSSLVPIPYTSMDMPAWEQIDPYQPREHPKGYLDYLTWPSNRIRLIPAVRNGQIMVETMTIAPGLTLSADVSSPHKRYVRNSDSEDWRFLRFDTDKALWRDYHSLLALDDANVKPPAVVDWLARLVEYGFIEEQYPLQLTATGMLADQAKPVFYRQERIPLPSGLLRDSISLLQISQAITDAEAIAQALRYATNTLAKYVLMRGGESVPDKTDRQNLIRQWGTVSHYWAHLELPFWNFVSAFSYDHTDALAAWREILIQNAKDSLAEAERSGGSNAAALQGQVMAERELHARIKKLFTQ